MLDDKAKGLQKKPRQFGKGPQGKGIVYPPLEPPKGKSNKSRLPFTQPGVPRKV